MTKASIGKIDIPNKLLLKFLTDHKELNQFKFKVIEGCIEVESKEKMYKKLAKGDPLIKEKGRDYLRTNTITESQKEFFKDFISRSNLTIDWGYPLDSCKLSDGVLEDYLKEKEDEDGQKKSI